ncbi:hypothetical protein [Petrotoga sp. 9PWA.NaAc.5.4]|uniref:hypothetical protein n=1 Tax=Petrotoga sp. 9PWA.NaAc.5.4 TaxID=1434328 RepID=UPI000CC86C0C|nr:hypothetical protein [Petrotoga sp. 9PWA.NaAc.5.4]PNR95630.1 hypothetical protein X924_04360 [Petrotoga sp. 9PWA.NaAc.5.4]
MFKKIVFFGICGIVAFTFVYNIFIMFKKDNDSINYLTSGYNYSQVPFIDYISSEEKVRKVTSNAFINVLDEKNVVFKKIKKLSSNEYAVLAENSNQYYIYYMDAQGQIKSKTFIESGNIRLNDFEYINNTFTVVGSKNGKPYIVNISRNGSMNWSKILNYQGEINKITYGLNEYTVGGHITINNNQQAYIGKFNTSGNTIWEHIYGRENEEEIIDIIDNGNSIIAVGRTNSNLEKENNLLFLEYSKDGFLLFYDEYGSSVYHEYPKSLLKDKEGNIYIGGYLSTLNQKEWKAFFMKVSKDIKNQNNLDVLFFETQSIKALSRIEDMKYYNDKIYLMGVTVETWPDYDIFLKIVNQNGILIDQRIYGKNNQEHLNSFEILEDEGILGVGKFVDSNNETYPLIIKTGSDYRIPAQERF